MEKTRSFEQAKKAPEYLSSPWDRASFISKWFLLFVVPLVRKGKKVDLSSEQGQTFGLEWTPYNDTTKRVAPKLIYLYHGKCNRSLIKSLITCFWSEIILIHILDLINKCLFGPLQTILLAKLVREANIYLNLITTSIPIMINNELQIKIAYQQLVCSLIVLLTITSLTSFSGHLFYLLSYRLGMKCRIATSSLIYKKSLKLSQANGGESNQLINLLSNDVNRFDEAVQMGPSLFTAPIQVSILIIIMQSIFLGHEAAIACSIAMTVFFVAQASLGFGFFSIRRLIARQTDKRVSVLSDILRCIRLVKSFAWQTKFKERVEQLRANELKMIGIISLLKAINQTLFFVSSKIFVYTALITFVYTQHHLNPEILAATILIGNLIRMSMTFFFPNAIAAYAELVVSCQRIDHFMNLPQIGEQQNITRQEEESNLLKSKKKFKSYDKLVLIAQDKSEQANSKKFSLAQSYLEENVPRNCDINLSYEIPEIIMLVGRVGSGKSTFLEKFLDSNVRRELGLKPDWSSLKISYTSQEPWIFAGSIRTNIILDSPFRRDLYSSVIDICELGRDLSPSSSNILKFGDQTVLIEGGSQLSRSQATRISLARALYQQADVYLLDNPLSALTPQSAKRIFERAIKKFLSDKLVLMATNQVHLLPGANRIMLFEAGSCVALNTLSKLQRTSSFISLIQEPIDTKKSLFSKKHSTLEGKSLYEFKLAKDYEFESDEHDNYDEDSFHIDQTHQFNQRSELISDECSNTQSYIHYAKQATNLIGLLWFITTNLAAQGFFQYTDIYLSSWTDSVQRYNKAIALGKPFQIQTYTDSLTMTESGAIYALSVLLCTIFALLRALTFYTGSWLASHRLHRRLIDSLLWCEIRFFDFRSMGMLMNRLTRDIGLVDDSLPTIKLDVISTWTSVIGVLIFTIIIDWSNVATSILFIILCYMMRRWCLDSIIRLKHAEAIARTPMFAHLAATLTGLTSIRAFSLTKSFENQFEKFQDAHTGVWFAFVCSGRLMALGLDLITLIFITLVLGIKVALTLDDEIPALMSLLVVQACLLPARVQWGSRQIAELESQMTSVQRLVEFSNLKQEIGSEIELHDQVQQNFSSNQLKGKIELEHVTLKYPDRSKPALKDISFKIGAGEKIGVIGETGSGKTSLISTLLRLYKFDGKVLIDGKDSSSIDLYQLRSSIAIVPEEPLLIGTTLRECLDPLNEHADFDLWAVLDMVQLLPLVESWPLGLATKISRSSGFRLSLGQRQLICLARAVVRRCKLLILDEAMASVDPESVALIQLALRQQTPDCTTITISHRIRTVINSDRVMVLADGHVCEFDDPDLLLLDRKSYFSQIVACDGHVNMKYK